MNHNKNNNESSMDYFIGINSSQYLEDANYNEANISIPAIFTQNSIMTYIPVKETAGNDESLLYNDVTHHVNASLYDSFVKFQNFSCDGESISVENLVNGTATGDAGEEESASALSSVYFKTAVFLLYIPIFIFALLGNGTVCYIVQSTPRMRTVTNFFITNLAVGDILMSTFCVPFSFVSIFILGYWPFGIALCYLVNYSQAVSVLVSAYTLVAISVDRYIAIMWPLRPRITKR